MRSTERSQAKTKSAERLRLALERINHTQASAARELGIAQSTMYRYCSGEGRIPRIVWLALRAIKPGNGYQRRRPNKLRPIRPV